MKYLYTLICALFILGPDNSSQRLNEELTNGRMVVNEIISKYDLKSRLEARPFLGFICGDAWIVVSIKDNGYVAFKGRLSTKGIYEERISNDEEGVNSLFFLKQKDFEKFTFYDVYTPFYYYFVLYSEDHSSFIECNSNMSSCCDQRCTMLPKDGQYFLFKLLLKKT